MTLRTPMTLLLCVVFSLAVGSEIAGNSLTTYQEKQSSSPLKTSFRYVITWNRIAEGYRYPAGGIVKSRTVSVLLDSKSFSEDSLRQLFGLLSKRFADPDELLIAVYTNFEDIRTPEENDVPASGPVDMSAPKYPWAFYVRNSESEHFSYHTKKRGSLVNTINLRLTQK